MFSVLSQRNLYSNQNEFYPGVPWFTDTYLLLQVYVQIPLPPIKYSTFEKYLAKLILRHLDMLFLTKSK